jgi:hypothetical protein
VATWLPEERVRLLLRHDDAAIAAAAAMGEWRAEPTGTVRESLRDDWRNAVIRAADDDYDLKGIFESDAALAFAWIERRVRTDEHLTIRDEYLVAAAVRVLSAEQREALLNLLPGRTYFMAGELTQQLVGNDLALYKRVLSAQARKTLHLFPLRGTVDDEWAAKAKLALEAGYPPVDIAVAAHGSFYSWTGDESATWENWEKSFEKLLDDPDPGVRAVAQVGRDDARDNRIKALAAEREEAVRGVR